LRGQGRPRYNQDTRNFILFFLFFIVSGASSSGFPFLRGQGRPRYIKTRAGTPSLHQNKGRDALATSKQGQEHPCYYQRYPELHSFFLFLIVSRASSSGFPFLQGQRRPRYVLSFPYPELPALVFPLQGQRRPRYIKTEQHSCKVQSKAKTLLLPKLAF